MFDFINKPFAYVLGFISDICGGNFAAAIFIFTIFINAIFIPLTIKSQKSAVQQTRIKPKLEALKAKYGDDKQKYTQEMQALYQREGVSMGGGCLPMIIRLIVMMSIYTLIMSPLTYMTGIEEKKVTDVASGISQGLEELKKEDSAKYNELVKELDWNSSTNSQLGLVKIVRDQDKLAALKENLPKEKYDKIEKDLYYIVEKDTDVDDQINYDFFGIDLTDTPHFSINIVEAWRATWILPLLAFATQMLSSVLSSIMQKKQNPDAPGMMGMMLVMPLISLFIGFGFPCGVTFYWACSSLIGGAIQILVQQFYGPHKLLSKERSKQLTKQCDFETTQINKLGEIGE